MKRQTAIMPAKCNSNLSAVCARQCFLPVSPSRKSFSSRRQLVYSETSSRRRCCCSSDSREPSGHFYVENRDPKMKELRFSLKTWASAWDGAKGWVGVLVFFVRDMIRKHKGAFAFTFSTSLQVENLKLSSSGIVSFQMMSCRLPLRPYAHSTQKFGGSMHAPTNGFILRWLMLWICRKQNRILMVLQRILKEYFWLFFEQVPASS